VAEETSGDERQRAQAQLFTKLYGLAAPVEARAFLNVFADVATLLAQNAPLDEDRTDWQCVSGALQLCLGRLRDDEEGEGKTGPNIL
jgi:hypothetical protein